MDTSGIGRRIAYWRAERGYTQSDFGHLMGQTKRWVQDIEGGKRQQDPRLSVLVRAAEILRVPLEQLLTDTAPQQPADNTPPADALRVIDALYGPGRDDDVPPRDVLQRRLDYCCVAFQACHYAALSRDLPALIGDAGRAVHAAPVGEQGEAHALLSRVYQLVTSYLHKYGAATAIPAALAADRALVAAERSGDPVQMGAAARRVAKSLVYQQRPAAAVEFATAAALRLADGLTDRGALGLSTLGMLYLSAALAESSQERTPGRVAAAGGYVAEAGDVAARQGADLDEDYTQFGPTNVTLHRMDVLLRFEDGWSALEAAEDARPEALAGMTRERQAGHRVAIARASLLTRRKGAAGAARRRVGARGGARTPGDGEPRQGRRPRYPGPRTGLAQARRALWTAGMTQVLYLIACAAGPTQHIDDGVRAAQDDGWDVCLILTPSAATWWEPRMEELVELTGHPVRSRYKLPWEKDALPKADAMLVAPMSCTTLNKWGAGISDTVAIGIPSEAVHMGVPVVAMPYFNQAQGAQPAVARSIAVLREQGILVLDGPDGYQSHPPKRGNPQAFPWGKALAGVRRQTGDR